MKKLLLLPLMCAASLAFAAPNTAIKALGQDLKSFSPASITAHQGAEKKETVVIVLPQARITDTIYTAVIKGACMRLWLEPKDKYLNSVAQIAGGPDLLEVGELPTGPVIYLPAEDPPTAIHHRLHALGAHLSAEERQAVADGLLIQPLIGSLPNIMAPEWFDGLKRAAEGRLMVLDTLRRFHIEEENASGPMAQVIGRMEAIAADTGCSIVFLHHASKGAAMMGAGDQQQASRGSSVLVDNIRWQSYLSSMTSAEAEEWGVDDDQRRFFVRFGVSKANYGAPFADRWFRRHDGGVLKPAVLERQRKSKGVPRGEA